MRFEDVRLSSGDNDFSLQISDALDEMDDEIDDDLDRIESSPKKNNIENINNQHQNSTDTVNSEIDVDNKVDFTMNDEKPEPKAGEHIYVYWPLDDEYCPVTVTAIEDGKTNVLYDNSDVEVLDMEYEIWKY